jgi:SAM-dependent methyltransferase
VYFSGLGAGLRRNSLPRVFGAMHACRDTYASRQNEPSRARQLGRDVDLREADALDLSFPDACFDTVVSAYVLCAVPDEHRVLTEMIRVLPLTRRPGQPGTTKLYFPRSGAIRCGATSKQH